MKRNQSDAGLLLVNAGDRLPENGTGIEMTILDGIGKGVVVLIATLEDLAKMKGEGGGIILLDEIIRHVEIILRVVIRLAENQLADLPRIQFEQEIRLDLHAESHHGELHQNTTPLLLGTKILLRQGGHLLRNNTAFPRRAGLTMIKSVIKTQKDVKLEAMMIKNMANPEREAIPSNLKSKR